MTSSTKANAALPRQATQKYRLASLVQEPGGLTDVEMIRRASARVELLQTPTLRALDEELANLSRLTDSSELDTGPFYDLSIRINEIAAVVGFPEVGCAAFSLCNLLDGCVGTSDGIREAISIHVSTMRLLRVDKPAPGAGDKLLTELRRLVCKTRPSQCA